MSTPPAIAALAIFMCLAPLRCIWLDSLEIQQHFGVAAACQSGDPLPFRPAGHDCHNESGCICRGATLARPVAIPQLHDCQTRWLGAEALPGPCQWTYGLGKHARRAVTSRLCFSVAFTGRQLRALYASLVI